MEMDSGVHMGLVDIAVLTYMPDKRFFEQIEILQRQTIQPSKIIVMNTEERYMNSLLYGTRFVIENPNVEIHHIAKLEFNHGKTRNLAAGFSSARFLVFMTQDAIPQNENLLSELLKPMKDKDVSVSYARQLAKEDANPIERYNRLFNYPPEDRIQTIEDVEQIGVKAYFCSDACACYRKRDFDRRGGFVRYTIFNEDMLYAAGAVQEGKKIYYASKAEVCHSHNYTAAEQFRRNFDLGVSQADHPEVFSGLNVKGEGGRLVKGCLKYLLSKGKFYLIPKFIIHCSARYLGYKKGLKYKKLSKKKIWKYTANKGYWERYWDRSEFPPDVTKGGVSRGE